MKNSFFNNLLYTFISVCMMGFVFANPSFDTDGDGQFDGLPSFNFDASVTGIIGDGTVGVVGQDYLVAHVDGEIRGIGLASAVPFGAYAGSIAYLTTYGDLDGGSVDAPGTAISFYFYDGATGDTTPINETINFISDGSDGSVTAPVVFTLGSSYPTAPDCADNDAGVSPFTCATAVASFGCDFSWGGSPISNSCPVECGACPDYDEGCMDSSADNYDADAEYHDDSCEYTVCEDDDAAVAPFDCASAIAQFGCDFLWGGSLIGDVCVASCNDACAADDIEGCMDAGACNYNGDATVDDGSCTFAQNNFDCDGNCTAGTDCNGDCGGSAVEDACGVCGGSGIADGECDCDGNVDLGCGCGEAGPSGCDNACGSTAVSYTHLTLPTKRIV